jgi:GntR family transcriptional regulator
MSKIVEKKRGSLPAYTQLADIIKNQIASGILCPGIRIPSEAKLAQQHNVSTMTVRQALSVLGEEGLVERIHGSGTFVKRIEVGSTTFEMNSLGKVLADTKALEVQLLKSNIAWVKGIEGERLQLKQDDPIILVERLISYEKKPFCFQIAYLPFDPKAPVVENMLETTGLSDLFFSRKSQGYKKGTLKLLPTQMDLRVAELLEITEDYSAFKLEYIYYNFADEPCAYGWFIIPPQQIPLVSQVGVWNV